MDGPPTWFLEAEQQLASTGVPDAIALTTAYWTPSAPHAAAVVVDVVPPSGDVDRGRAAAMMLAQAWMVRAAVNGMAMARNETFDQVFQRIAAKAAGIYGDQSTPGVEGSP